jgi:hypothetical protein
MINSRIRVLQVNLNRSAPATESALQLAIELKIDLVIVQEPWTIPKPRDVTDYLTTRSVNHPSFTQILPASLVHRPRTLVYIARGFKPTVNIASDSPLDPDIIAIDITEGNSKIHLLNIYNEADQGDSNTNTLERHLYTRDIKESSIVLGDFNTHHPWWDPLARPSEGSDTLAVTAGNSGHHAEMPEPEILI